MLKINDNLLYYLGLSLVVLAVLTSGQQNPSPLPAARLHVCREASAKLPNWPPHCALDRHVHRWPAVIWPEDWLVG